MLRTLKLDSAIACREIGVESQDGLVTLSGTAPSYQESAAVREATRGTPGACGVVNKIEVKADRFFTLENSRRADASALSLGVVVSTSSEAGVRVPRAPQ